MQPETAPQQYNNIPIEPIEPPTPAKSRSSWKKVLLFALVVIFVAALSGVSVWAYMSNQNNNNSKSLNAQITTKSDKITSLQLNVKSLQTQIAAKTTTTSTTSGMYEALAKFCGSNNKTVQYTNMSNDLTNGTNVQYFGACAVAPAGALTGGYIITAMYTNNTWQELFEGQGLSEAQAAICTTDHIPTQIGTCS
jgi:cell division protein FtsL